MTERQRDDVRPPLSQQQFRDILTEAGMRYEPSNVDQAALSGPVNPAFSRLPGHLPLLINSAVEASRIYLSYPVITDTLDHVERRSWRTAMSKKYGPDFTWKYENNRIKGNNVYNLDSHFKGIESSINRKEELSGESATLLELMSHFPDISHYDDIGTEEKLEIVHKLDTFCVDFLKLVTLPHE